MDYILTIVFFIIFFLTGNYISYTARKYYNKKWHSPWDWVRYWRMFHETGSKLHKWIFTINIASLVVAIVLIFTLPEKDSEEQPTEQAYAEQCHLARPNHINPEQWAVVENNCGYFVRLLEEEDSLNAGKTLSAREVQALMPRSEMEFRASRILGVYTENSYTSRLEELATQYAIADSLDMMEHFLMWSVWADCWEYPWEVAIEIEHKHPEKFRRTIERIWDKGWIESYEEYRDAYLEYINIKDTN